MHCEHANDSNITMEAEAPLLHHIFWDNDFRTGIQNPEIDTGGV